jgi:hypothetical protein
MWPDSTTAGGPVTDFRHADHVGGAVDGDGLHADLRAVQHLLEQDHAGQRLATRVVGEGGDVGPGVLEVGLFVDPPHGGARVEIHRFGHEGIAQPLGGDEGVVDRRGDGVAHRRQAGGVEGGAHVVLADGTAHGLGRRARQAEALGDGRGRGEVVVAGGDHAVDAALGGDRRGPVDGGVGGVGLDDDDIGGARQRGMRRRAAGAVGAGIAGHEDVLVAEPVEEGRKHLAGGLQPALDHQKGRHRGASTPSSRCGACGRPSPS